LLKKKLLHNDTDYIKADYVKAIARLGDRICRYIKISLLIDLYLLINLSNL
jgi:hypothetical protein